ncbi:MAG: DedA family protein [Ruthenibacterium sp.]
MRDVIFAVLGKYGYYGVFGLIAVENIFPPIPSEVILTFGGFLTTCTELTVWGVIFASTFGSMAGAAVLYGAGRLLRGQKLMALLGGKTGKMLHLEAEDVQKASAWFNRRGWPCVFYCRCVPIVRSLISIPAGMAEMRLLPFFVLTFCGSFLWNIVLVSLGAWAGESWGAVSAVMAHLSDGAKLLLFGVLILSVLWLSICQKRKKEGKYE